MLPGLRFLKRLSMTKMAKYTITLKLKQIKAFNLFYFFSICANSNEYSQGIHSSIFNIQTVKCRTVEATINVVINFCLCMRF